MKVILDLLDLQESVVVGRMTLSHARLFNIRHHGLYALTLFSQLYPIETDYTREAIVGEIRQHFSSAGDQDVQTTTRAPQLSTTPFVKTSEGVHMQDLESGLFYSLWVEVPSRNVLEGTNLEAMKKYVDVLARYLPAEEHITKFLHKLNVWLKTRTSSLTAAEWLHHITNLQSNDSYVPNRVQWTWCHGSQAQFRGYPCSLWMTFHTLTVNAYLREQHNASYSPNEVIGAIRGYVDHFLGCRDCARNFVRGAAQTLDGPSARIPRYRQDRNGAVLWMWYSHNRANHFLAADATEDPLFPKVQFPVAEACPTCHLSGGSSGSGNWNETAVFEYLVNFYREEAIVDDDPHDGFDPNSGTMFLRKKAAGAGSRSSGASSGSGVGYRLWQVPGLTRQLMAAVFSCLVSFLILPGLLQSCC
jgi:thiol oxidase